MNQKVLPSSRRSNETIASFLLKTYEILERHDYEHIICWDKDNIGFIVKDVVALTSQVLPKYFRHSNFSSFVRQVAYIFQSAQHIKQDNDSLVFKNPLFCHGKQQNLRLIKRKAANKISSTRKISRNDRSCIQNEKYFNTLKVFKKAVDSEIETTHSILEKFIHSLAQNNQSNVKKTELLSEIKMTSQKQINLIDTLYELKENCYEYFNRNEIICSESLNLQKNKIKVYLNYAQNINQLHKDHKVHPVSIPNLNGSQEGKEVGCDLSS